MTNNVAKIENLLNIISAERGKKAAETIKSLISVLKMTFGEDTDEKIVPFFKEVLLELATKEDDDETKTFYLDIISRINIEFDILLN